MTALERLRIDQLLRCHPVDIDVEQRHALFDQTLGTGKTDTALVCQQLTDSPHAAAAQMIDIIESAFAAPQVDQILDCSDKIFFVKIRSAESTLIPSF